MGDDIAMLLIKELQNINNTLIEFMKDYRSRNFNIQTINKNTIDIKFKNNDDFIKNQYELIDFFKSVKLCNTESIEEHKTTAFYTISIILNDEKIKKQIEEMYLTNKQIDTLISIFGVKNVTVTRTKTEIKERIDR